MGTITNLNEYDQREHPAYLFGGAETTAAMVMQVAMTINGWGVTETTRAKAQLLRTLRRAIDDAQENHAGSVELPDDIDPYFVHLLLSTHVLMPGPGTMVRAEVAKVLDAMLVWDHDVVSVVNPVHPERSPNTFAEVNAVLFLNQRR